MRFASKQELLDSIEREHSTFLSIAASIPTARYSEAGVWGSDWLVESRIEQPGAEEVPSSPREKPPSLPAK
jgi:hypothetical protein